MLGTVEISGLTKGQQDAINDGWSIENRESILLTVGENVYINVYDGCDQHAAADFNSLEAARDFFLAGLKAIREELDRGRVR